MAKSNEQLDARNEEVKPEEVKFAKLNEKDLEQVSGGTRKRLFFHLPTQSIRTHTPKIRKKAIQTPMKPSRNGLKRAKK